MALCECRVDWDDKTCTLHRCPMHNAAPEMLKALKVVVWEIDSDRLPEVWWTVSDAIDKAEGRDGG